MVEPKPDPTGKHMYATKVRLPLLPTPLLSFRGFASFHRCLALSNQYSGHEIILSITSRINSI